MPFYKRVYACLLLLRQLTDELVTVWCHLSANIRFLPSLTVAIYKKPVTEWCHSPRQFCSPMIYYQGKKLCKLLQIDTILLDNIIVPSYVNGGVYNATCDILPDNIIFTLSYLGSLQCKMLQFSQPILYPHSLVLRFYAEQSLGQNNSIHILSFWNSIQRNLLQYVTFSKRISYSFISPRQYTEQPVAEWCTSPENIIFLPCFTKVECKSTFGSVVSLSKRIPNSHSGLLRHHAQQLLTRLCCSPR